MRQWFLVVQRSNATGAATPEELYGFRAEDVIEVHKYKNGTGQGLWLRLQDGRVFDTDGRPSEPEREWYEHKQQ